MELAQKTAEPSAPSVVKVKWIDGMQFVAADSTGHSIVMELLNKEEAKAQASVRFNFFWRLWAAAQA